ncbi:hypothetical protein KDJ56_06975 [Brevibacillus composti]|uniref:Uncharacterized protein n=1 Tax=Brevibacillus composti TaxID=2796470 RepID=A0A7T5EN43_9BACL|nr:hypothetical protein [Brevibacillus composti]QQE75678.1 hypothetical protein JD108_07295 [Brevibacillus composti]QUO42704.1 hypothetical protein KDJ56_06975 [Brevibacillus composti]
MKKIVWTLLLLLLIAIVVCFATDRFMLAYGLIFFLMTILTAIGHVYSIDNQIYLDKKRREADDSKRW